MCTSSFRQVVRLTGEVNNLLAQQREESWVDVEACKRGGISVLEMADRSLQRKIAFVDAFRRRNAVEGEYQQACFARAEQRIAALREEFDRC